MKNKLRIVLTLIIGLQVSALIVNVSDAKHVYKEENKIKPLYDDVWGAIYHAEANQCDDTPTITGDGSRIQPHKASDHRWIAISQEMLDCEYREKLLNKASSELYKGKIQYGDTVWIQSPSQLINGYWVVHDAKNYRYRRSIDFLQTKDDGTLYNNNPKWDGKFENIEIYAYRDAETLGLTEETI